MKSPPQMPTNTDGVGLCPMMSQTDKQLFKQISDLFDCCPIPRDQLFHQLPLFLSRQKISRLLYLDSLYQKIVNVHGVLLEFGVYWGYTLALWTSLRGIYEPYNYTRTIIGFDTFSGFPEVSRQDGTAPRVKEGELSVSKDYKSYLQSLMEYHEAQSPISHIRKFKLVEGDVNETLPRYLKDHPETIVAMAHFDLDLYKPTKCCLELLSNHITRGTVLIFDELCYPEFPGETLAFNEVFGLKRFAIHRSPLHPHSSWVVVD